jgi:hypothetical protein
VQGRLSDEMAIIERVLHGEVDRYAELITGIGSMRLKL